MKTKRKATTVVGFMFMILFFATLAKMLYNLEHYPYPQEEANLAYEFGKALKEILSSFWNGWRS
jgi:hypothetical protein